MCRLHAPCSKRLEGKGSHWSREGCAICSRAWESVCNAADPAIVQPALASLRTWVGGFSRNTRGPYLDSDIARSVLFPKARPSAVVGALEDPATETSADVSPDVSPVEEEELLQEPSPSADDIEEPMDQEIVDLPPQAPAVPEPKPANPVTFLQCLRQPQLLMIVGTLCSEKCNGSGLN